MSLYLVIYTFCLIISYIYDMVFSDRPVADGQALPAGRYISHLAYEVTGTHRHAEPAAVRPAAIRQRLPTSLMSLGEVRRDNEVEGLVNTQVP